MALDDHPMAETADLTTVHQSVMEQGVRAGHLCLDLLHDHHVEHEQVIIPTHLIIRRTTAPTRTPEATQPQPRLTA